MAPLGFAQDAPAVKIAAAYTARVAHIETLGVMFNGTEEPGSGSGLLVADGYVLTNSHVIPPEENYKNFLVLVRLSSRLAKPRSVAAVMRDRTRDLALLRLTEPVTDAPAASCPMPVVRKAEDVPVGTQIYVLGFPLNEDIGVSGGLLSSHTASKGRWRTDALITYGHSGGPAFDGRGYLIGVAVGGVGSFTVGGETRDVDGINFIVPATAIRQSELMKTIEAIPQASRCWSEQGERNLVAGLAGPEKLSRTFTISGTKDDHPVVFASHSRQYSPKYFAEPGYVITDCSFEERSGNKVSDQACNIEAGGRAAVYHFRLTSGPALDRWRGWLAGTLTLAQRRQP